MWCISLADVCAVRHWLCSHAVHCPTPNLSILSVYRFLFGRYRYVILSQDLLFSRLGCQMIGSVQGGDRSGGAGWLYLS